MGIFLVGRFMSVLFTLPIPTFVEQAEQSPVDRKAFPHKEKNRRWGHFFH